MTSSIANPGIALAEELRRQSEQGDRPMSRALEEYEPKRLES
jgi:hypothetical protein